MKDYKATKTNDRSFEWFYEYKDNIAGKEIIDIQTVYVKDHFGTKRFHFDRKMKRNKEGQNQFSVQTELTIIETRQFSLLL